MYLESIELNFIQPCTTDSLRIRIKASLSRDISELFPYLNTYLKTSIYNSKNLSITFNLDKKIIIIYPNEIAVAKILNETDAFEVLDYLKDIINEVYDKKSEINPSYEIKKLPSPLEIYKYLPKLNCKQCGQETCIAFATKLINGSTNLKRCLRLYEVGNENNKDQVENIILLLGYEI